MTGPEHYKAAEELLGYAQEIDHEDRGCARETSLLREAQVHATLALAAATAIPEPREDDAALRHAWHRAAGRS